MFALSIAAIETVIILVATEAQLCITIYAAVINRFKVSYISCCL